MGRLSPGILALWLVAAGCDAPPTAAPRTPAITAAATGPAAIASPDIGTFTPGSVSMWSRSSYVLGGATAVKPGAAVTVTGVVAITSDAGKMWRLVPVDPGPIVGVSVGPEHEVWALGSSADGSNAAPLFHSTDDGASWSALPTAPALFSTIAFAFDGHGYALAIKPGTEDETTGVFATDDGGSTWTALGNPCPLETQLVGLATAGERAAWVGCVGQPGTIEQPKAIRWTNDVGSTWSTTGFVNPVDGSHLGDMPSSGHLAGLASGRGGNLWAWQDRGIPLLSDDLGRTWKQVHLGDPDVATVFSMTRDDHRETLALLWNGDAQAVQLLASFDDGDTWQLVRAFPMPS